MAAVILGYSIAGFVDFQVIDHLRGDCPSPAVAIPFVDVHELLMCMSSRFFIHKDVSGATCAYCLHKEINTLNGLLQRTCQYCSRRASIESPADSVLRHRLLSTLTAQPLC